MKIKYWVEAIFSLGGLDAVIGNTTHFDGATYYHLTLAKCDADDEFYDRTPEDL